MDLWAPDPDPQVAAIEGRLCDTLSNYLYHVHADAHRTLGLPGVPVDAVQAAYRSPLAKADTPSRAARLFAEMLAAPPKARSARDLAELLSQEWYERGLVEDETRRAVVAANLRGRIEHARAVPAPVPLHQSDHDATLIYGLERACEHVTRVRDSTRHLLAGAVQDALLRGDSPQQLAVDLTSRFGTLNRDCRRLAITEIAFARANGFLAGCPDGAQVEWFTAAGCCAACARLNGKKFTVRRTAGDPKTDVWPGKHSVGLSAEARTPSIPFHPNCRCRWVLVAPSAPAGVSSRTLAALAALDES